MSTKVKGEAIKEGSIPLSALSDKSNRHLKDWGMFDYVGKLGGGVTQLPHNYYKCVIYDDCNKEIYTMMSGDSVVIKPVPKVMVKFDGSIVTLYDPENVYRNEQIFVYKSINTINNKYLPNTVLKTTPQSLSETDKNQALANLGIADLLEALKPVRLSGEPPVGNVTQEQLDEIGLTEKVINNILNGYTNKIYINKTIYNVTNAQTSISNEGVMFKFSWFDFAGDTLNGFFQYTYDHYKNTGDIIITKDEF